VDEYDPKKASRRIRIPLSFEAKCAESWDFVQLFKDSDKGPLHAWWAQASADAKSTDKLPALVFTRNYVPVFIMVRTSTLNKLAKLVGSSWKKSAIKHRITKERVVVVLLDDFLGWVDFTTFLKLKL